MIATSKIHAGEIVIKEKPLIVIPPRSTAMIPPGYVKTTLLHLFDVGSPSRMTLKDKRDTFRTLQKYLTSEIGMYCM